MAPNSKGPFFVQMNYHSEFGPHSQQIPLRDWRPGSPGSIAGDCEAWDLSIIPANDMVTDLRDHLIGFFPSSTIFDNFLIFKQIPATENYTPVAGATLDATAGTLSPPGWSKAVQATLTWRTTAFGLFKLDLLDMGSEASFDKLSSVPGSGKVFEIDAVVTLVTNAWSGRDNAKPNTFVSETKTLNKKLRRAYRMT